MYTWVYQITFLQLYHGYKESCCRRLQVTRQKEHWKYTGASSAASSVDAGLPLGWVC